MNRRAFLHRLAALAGAQLFGLFPLSRVLAAPGPAAAPKIVIIIDDIGYSLQRLDLFLSLDLPLTFAVLPRLAFSAAAARRIACQGHPVLLHQPMQPRDRDISPGPGALYVGDSERQIRRVLEANLDGLPGAIGVNNHMGSLFTGRQPEIQMALEVIRDSGLFFIDSLTSHRSEAYQTARRLNIPASRRNVFLDNRPEVPCILKQLQHLTALAQRTGLAIGVGHPHRQTAEAIGRFKAIWQQRGILAVHSSRLFDPQRPA